MNSLEAQTLHPIELSAADKSAWQGFRARHPAFANPLLGPDFAQAVGRVREDARILVLKRHGETVGFLPHHIRPGGLARPIGAPLSDYHALVSASPVNSAEALAAGRLTAFRYHGLVDPLRSFEAPATRRDAFAVTLEGPVEPYLEGLRAASAKKFKNWRRLDHKLDREEGALRLVPADTNPASFHQLLAWKREQLRRTGGHDFLAAEWTGRLFEQLFAAREGNFQGLMICLYAQDRLVAGHFGMREGDFFHPWIASVDPGLAAYSPGQIFLTRAIAAMPELGLTRYDFGPGHDHYKRAYAPVETVVGGGMAAARTAAGQTILSVERLLHRAAGNEDSFAARIRRRLDVIESTETTLAGFTRGLADAVAGQARRRQAEGAAGAEAA